ncbi:uncharacterized protein LOC104925592 isoform X2 [Larimichthys crocea]|uniref:uncharacterized protein LOC104925592 isoform X2 n=1 Tax=Larimichthys crocea TaxID=215358 RepID=UPI000F5DA59E|nr:uncharacterized protein LOC104925592 isoform X2 [Larimichthys crocea]
MAAALFRRGTGLCVRCIHRELCRMIWRPQTAFFSSKASDRKQPRRTHIKKAKPQPALDVAKLLEQLFSQRRPGTAPPDARPTKGSSMPTKPPTISSKVSTSNVPSLLKTETAASSVPQKTTSTFNAAPLSPQPKSASSTNPKTSSETPQQYPHDLIQGFAADSVSSVTLTSTAPASLGPEAAAIGGQTSTEAVETNVETATEPVELKTDTVLPLSAAIVEPSIETTTELPVEPIMSTLEGRAAVVEGPVEPTVDVPAEDVQTKGTDSGMVDILQTAKVEPSIETTTELPVEPFISHVETLEGRAAVVEGPVEPTVDVPAEDGQTKGTDSGVVDILQTAKVEPSIETTTELPVEPFISHVETLEGRPAIVEGPVEPTVDVPAEDVQTQGTDSGVVDILQTAKVEPSIETTTELPVEPFISHVETLKGEGAIVEGPVEPTVDVPAEDVQTKGTDSGVVDILQTAKVEPSIETTTELPVEPFISHVETLEGRAAIVEGPVEPTVDVPAEDVQTKGTDSGVVDILQTAKEEPLIETAIDLQVEISHVPLETLESRAADVVGPVEPTIDVTVEAAAESTNSGVADISHTASVELLLETTVEPPVDATVDALAIQTNSTDSGVVTVVIHSAKDEPLIETTIEAAVEASTLPLESGAVVSKGPVEPTIDKEAADNLSHTALVQDVQESAPLPLTNEAESTLGSVALEEGVNRSEQMTLESVTLHVVRGLVGSLKTQELLQTKDALDEEAEKQLQELLVQTGTEAEYKAAAETGSSSEDESEDLTKALSKWISLSEDLQELEGESATLVTEHLCHVPAVLSKTPTVVETSSTSDPAVVANGESMQVEEKGTEAEAMSLESITLAKVKAEVGGLEAEVLLETSNALEKEAEALAKEEKMEVKTTIEDVEVFEDTTEADILALDSISEATEAIEAETSIIMEAMFGSEQGPRQPPDTLLVVQTEDSREQEGTLEAMTLESVTLAEVEASLGTLENESLSETTDYLEKEAEIFAEEKRMEIDDGVASEEMAEAPKIESLFLPEDDALSEALQTDTLMGELLFSIPGHVTGVTEDPIGQEVVRMDILDATVATGSIDVDSATAVTDDFPASPAVKEVLLGQDEGAQTAALGNEDVKGTHTDLDPVQRLFLEKIKEYDNMRRLSGGLLEAEPDYVKYLSEETAKLQRLYGGGDLSNFPEFTFTEPEMDQDSK